MSRMRAFRLKLLVVAIFAAGIVFFGLKMGKRELAAAYDHDKLSLLARFVAKEYCTCRFVTQQSEAYCGEYIGAEIPFFGIRLNTNFITSYSVSSGAPGGGETPPVSRHTVRATALYFAKAEARYYENAGCRLLP